MQTKKVLAPGTKVRIDHTDCTGVVMSSFSMSHDNKWYHVVHGEDGSPLGDYRLEQLTVIEGWVI